MIFRGIALLSGTSRLIHYYLVSERKLEIFSNIKEGENYNHRNPDAIGISRIYPPQAGYNLSLTQRLGKITVFGQALCQ
jgi:hypothetical protein